jgi:hypothetical protein
LDERAGRERVVVEEDEDRCRGVESGGVPGGREAPVGLMEKCDSGCVE